MYRTRSSASGAKNDGQPQCDSNLVSLVNSSAPQARHRYTPRVLVSTYSPVNAGSVPAWRSTRNSAGDRRNRHSSSVAGSSVNDGVNDGSVFGSIPPP